MASQARESTVFRETDVHTINPGIDLTVFSPRDRSAARELFGIDPADQVVLFASYNSATDRDKGWDFLHAAVELAQPALRGERLRLMLVGPLIEPDAVPLVPVDTVCVGKLADGVSLSLAYSAADVVAAPSPQEPFGKVAAEALACGTPVVAFAGTGLADVVEHKRSGYLARWGSAEDLADGLVWTLREARRSPDLRAAARERAVSRFAAHAEAEAYLALYERLVRAPGSNGRRPRL
jgi:glycosyltransferase involved in cell wall biosynthesis